MSLDKVTLSPLASGFTVRRAKICAGVRTVSAKLRSSANADGPVTCTSTVPAPAALAVIGMVAAPRCLARSASFSVARAESAPVPFTAMVIVAGRAFDIVEIEMQAGAVAGQQEARQRRAQHHRIAHHDVSRGMADLVLAPATAITRTVPAKAGTSKLDLRGAVGADLHEAGIERHRRAGRRVALQASAPASPPLRIWPRAPCMPSIRSP